MIPSAAQAAQYRLASNAPRSARNSEMNTASSGSPIAVITMPRKIAA